MTRDSNTAILPREMAPPKRRVHWFVYVLTSLRRSRTYVGITTDPLRRLAQHNGERPGGARATRAGRPWRLAAEYGPYDARSAALRVERALKRRRGRARLCRGPAAET